MTDSRSSPVTEAMIEAAAKEMWNDRDARMGGSWENRSPDEVCVIQTKATAKAALNAALRASQPATPTGGETFRPCDGCKTPSKCMADEIVGVAASNCTRWQATPTATAQSSPVQEAFNYITTNAKALPSAKTPKEALDIIQNFLSMNYIK